jgi:NDP-sugar pyrophosphorylase family protein
LLTRADGAIEAILLAAGRGERLRPLTDLVPKPGLLLPGGPLGAWRLEALLGSFTNVAVNVSHLGEMLIRQLKLDGRARIIDEGSTPFGTAGTLAHVKAEVAETVLVANADLLTDLSIARLRGHHETAGGRATVAVVPVESGADFVVEDGLVTRFVDRRMESARRGHRFLGMSVIDRGAITELPNEKPLGLGESVLKPLAEDGDLAALEHDGYALDVGTIARYLQAASDVLTGAAPPAPPGPAAQGGDAIEVHGGRAYIGRGASFDDGVLGPGAIVLAGAQIGSGSWIEGSIVWPGEAVPSGSVLKKAVWFGGRALRLEF